MTPKPISKRQQKRNVYESRRDIKRDYSHNHPEYWFDWWRILRKFINKNILKKQNQREVSIAKHYGTRFLADPTTGMGRELIVYEGYEYKQIRWIIRKIKTHPRHKADFFLDLGSNIGMYGNIIGKHELADFIHMFEPNTEVCKVLFANLMLNGLHLNKQVKHHECAVSDKTSMDILYSHALYNDERNHISSASNDQKSTHDKSENVVMTSSAEIMDLKIRQIISSGGSTKGYGKSQRKKMKARPTIVIALDDMFKQRNKFFVIKMDIEGNELKALKGMENIIKHNDILLQVEIFPRNAEKVLTYIEAELKMKIHKRYGSTGFSDYMCSNFLCEGEIDDSDIIYPPIIADHQQGEQK